MIPSLASAGYLEPIDDYMKKADFKIAAVADSANFMTYKGQTYGIPTDSNVHIQYKRKDLLEDETNKKRTRCRTNAPGASRSGWRSRVRS
ncbi:MAG TPA: extracellular solute-binding protein [Xanthobacteraceae bacterium]|jgi:maltose-binding protein MalE